MFPVFLSVITTRHTTKIRIYPLQMLYIFIIFELLFYLHISKYSVGVTTGIFEVTWHSPQLKQGILVSSTTALTNTLRYCNVLHSVHKLYLYCSRMPYGTVFIFMQTASAVLFSEYWYLHSYPGHEPHGIWDTPRYECPDFLSVDFCSHNSCRSDCSDTSLVLCEFHFHTSQLYIPAFQKILPRKHSLSILTVYDSGSSP